MPALFRKVAIIGVGLIGGSLGMAIKKDKLADWVIGVDVENQELQLAKELRAIDAGYLEFTDQVADADLVVLAAPITINFNILETIKPKLKPGTIITDVGSTKGDFVRACQSVLGDQYFFVGGHPMAGSETTGVKGADPYLFENAIYVLTPTKETDATALTRVKLLCEGIGSRLVEIDPDEHDLLVAAISHLPHLVASTLVNSVAAIEDAHPHALMLAAGGFRDTTRIASGNPRLWRDICFSNQDQLLRMISIFKENLNSFETQLRGTLKQEFEQSMAQAKDVRAKIPAKLKGYWPFLEEIVVTIPDKPGLIGKVAAILGRQGVNIDDIEILRVREGEGGSLRLGFAQVDAADKAVKILGEHGFLARARK